MKNKIIIAALLIHGIVYNFMVAPALIYIGKSISVVSIAQKDWIYSIAVNLFIWQMFGYYLEITSAPKKLVTLSGELKKVDFLLFIRSRFLNFLQNKSFRKYYVKFLLWYGFAVNLMLALIVAIIFPPEDIWLFILSTLISFQFVAFGLYFYHLHFTEEVDQVKRKMYSPWLTDLIFSEPDVVKKG